MQSSKNSKQLMKKVVDLPPPAQPEKAFICDTKNIWTRTEDIKLMELIEQHGDKNWTKIAQMIDKTSKKCS